MIENSILLQLDARELHDLHSHPDIRKARKAPEIYNISLQSTFFIGMDTTKHKPVVTDRNPNLEGLVDIHQCVYLPSAYEKQQSLPDNLPQVKSLYIPLFAIYKVAVIFYSQFGIFAPPKPKLKITAINECIYSQCVHV